MLKLSSALHVTLLVMAIGNLSLNGAFIYQMIIVNLLLFSILHHPTIHLRPLHQQGRLRQYQRAHCSY